jgi:hypothetical protein
MLPPALAFGEAVGEMIIPQTPLDIALLALGGPFSRAFKTGALALGGALTSSDAEAGPFNIIKRGGRALPLDQASRMKRAEEMGFRRTPVEFSVAPARGRWPAGSKGW